jgi:hypothetical protein
MHPVLIEIGSLTIRWYGVMIAFWRHRFSLFFWNSGILGFYAAILLCPLLHFVFMRTMSSKKLHKGSSKNQIDGVRKMKEY